MAEIQVGLVQPENIPYVFPDLMRLFELKSGDWLDVVEPEDVVRRILLGELDLWMAVEGVEFRGAVVCGWDRQAKQTFYSIHYAGGYELEKFIKQGLKKIELYAAMNGASAVVVDGRMGWQKMLQPYGYGDPRVQVRKSVVPLWS